MKAYKSDKGYLCLELKGKQLHSKYNPQREAERFIDRSLSGSPRLIVLLGAGLGYIQESLTRKFPSSRILALYHDKRIFENRIFSHPGISSWHPGSNLSLDRFLAGHISELDLPRMALLEWEPSSRMFPSLSIDYNRRLKECVQQLNGNIQTTAFFGQKWLRNMLTNFLSINHYAAPLFPAAPVVIASSGPSLRQSLKQIKAYRGKFLLFALPSSLEALSEKEIVPDLQISTDPGYYGSVHLRSGFPAVPLAQPLTSCRGVWRLSSPVYLLNQSTPFERDLFRSLPMEYRSIPSNGTVSGTALELASSMENEVYFAGLDLCFYDIKSHVRPHSFETLLYSPAERTDPIQSVAFRRAFSASPDFEKRIRTGRSLETYRNWFGRQCLISGGRLKRLNPSPVTIDNMKEGNLSELKAYPDVQDRKWRHFEAPPLDKRRNIATGLINNWIEQIGNGENEELFYFLDTESCLNSGDRSGALNDLERMRNIYG